MSCTKLVYLTDIEYEGEGEYSFAFFYDSNDYSRDEAEEAAIQAASAQAGSAVIGYQLMHLVED